LEEQLIDKYLYVLFYSSEKIAKILSQMSEEEIQILKSIYDDYVFFDPIVFTDTETEIYQLLMKIFSQSLIAIQSKTINMNLSHLQFNLQ
jgi:hypothetical protein